MFQTITHDAEQIEERLAELDCEWDRNQAATTLAAGTCLLTAVLTVRRGGAWLFLSLIGVQALVLGHALSPGKSPFPSILGRCGLRTRSEIDHERRALAANRARE